MQSYVDMHYVKSTITLCYHLALVTNTTKRTYLSVRFGLANLHVSVVRSSEPSR